MAALYQDLQVGRFVPRMNDLLPILCVMAVTALPAPPLFAQQIQPGATQGRATTGEKMMPPFD